MNPFTRFLSRQSADRALAEFVSYWDRLEQLTIQVYRQQVGSAQAEQEFETVWPWLREAYAEQWRGLFSAYWQATQAAGEPTRVDPFELLLAVPSVSAIADNWRLLQHLPAAREALNRYIAEVTT